MKREIRKERRPALRRVEERDVRIDQRARRCFCGERTERKRWARENSRIRLLDDGFFRSIFARIGRFAVECSAAMLEIAFGQVVDLRNMIHFTIAQSILNESKPARRHGIRTIWTYEMI